MKALSKSNLTILLSACMVLSAVSNADDILPPATASTSSTAPLTYQETTIYSFAGGTDGVKPRAGLIQGSDGNFYGTTAFGGGGCYGVGCGTVFKITSQGQETVLHSLSGSIIQPPTIAGVIQGSDGNFYGTTVAGADKNDTGTVFKLTPQGQETILYKFTGGNDGAYPEAGLLQASDGNFYGTTYFGGGGSNLGSGTVFKVTPQGKETVLYRFTGGNDGENPQAQLIQASDGNLYGTTYQGGNNGVGTVFKVTLQGQETVLHRFTGITDGAYPNGLIQAKDGNFYGTTINGGATNKGTVFKVTPQGQETVLYKFAGVNDGEYPFAGLLQASDGNFYGTTQWGGSATNGSGTIFRITPQGVETVLYSFTDASIGANPEAGLIQASDGNFYGTTSGGGATNNGSVFKITPKN